MESSAHRDVDRTACAAVIARAESRLAAVTSSGGKSVADTLRHQLQQISLDLVESIAPVTAVQIEEWSDQPVELIDCFAEAGKATDDSVLLFQMDALSESRKVRLAISVLHTHSDTTILPEMIAALHPLLTAAIVRVRLGDLQSEQQLTQRLLESVALIETVSHHDLAVALADYGQDDRVWILSSKNGNAPFQVEACSSQSSLDKNAELAIQTESLVERSLRESKDEHDIDAGVSGAEVLFLGSVGDSFGEDEPALKGYESAKVYCLSGRQLIALSLRHAGNPRSTRADSSALIDVIARGFLAHRRQVAKRNSLSSRLSKMFRQPIRWLIALAVILVLTFWPITLRIRARGRVIANSEQVVFSPVRGQIKQIFVAQGQTVSAGEPLFELINPDLDFRASELRGEWLTVTEQRQIAESQRGESRSNANSSTVLADRRVLEVRQRELQKQLDLIDQQRSDLVMRCQNPGVATWTVSEDGSVPAPGRPIEFGERMIRIVDRTAGFRVRLEVPDNDIGEVLRQQASIGESVQDQSSLSAEYEIHSEGVRHTAVVEQISDVAVVSFSMSDAGSGQLVVPVTLRPQDQNQGVEVARAFMVDASVTGWVDCGRRPAGQVLFRKLIQRLKWTGWL